MADATGGNDPQPAPADRVEALAKKLLRSASENGLEPGDLEGARRQASRMLEDSEARTTDPATTDPEHDSVIRRSSSETASSGETQTKRTSTGE
jgi:hypothetical protein